MSRLRDHTVQQKQKAVLSTLKVCSEKSVVETRTELPTEKENIFFSKTKVNKGPNMQGPGGSVVGNQKIDSTCENTKLKLSDMHHNVTLNTWYQSHYPLILLLLWFWTCCRISLKLCISTKDWVRIRAVQFIECDYLAHLVSKAGSLIGTKSSSPAFKWSGS